MGPEGLDSGGPSDLSWIGGNETRDTVSLSSSNMDGSDIPELPDLVEDTRQRSSEVSGHNDDQEQVNLAVVQTETILETARDFAIRAGDGLDKGLIQDEIAELQVLTAELNDLRNDLPSVTNSGVARVPQAEINLTGQKPAESGAPALTGEIVYDLPFGIKPVGDRSHVVTTDPKESTESAQENEANRRNNELAKIDRLGQEMSELTHTPEGQERIASLRQQLTDAVTRAVARDPKIGTITDPETSGIIQERVESLLVTGASDLTQRERLFLGNEAEHLTQEAREISAALYCERIDGTGGTANNPALPKGAGYDSGGARALWLGSSFGIKEDDVRRAFWHGYEVGS